MSMEDVQLIPRTTFFGNPERAMVRLSPDGCKLAFLAPEEGVLNVWVAPVDQPDAAEAVTHDRGRGIQGYDWAHTSEHILYIQDKDGDENWRLYCVDLKSKEANVLTDESGVQARIAKTSPHSPREIVVALNNRDPRWHDLYRVDIVTGERSLMYQNERFASFLLDDALRLRFGVESRPDGGSNFFRYTDGGEWELYGEVPPADSLTTALLAIHREGQILYSIDSRDRNTSAFVATNLATGEERVLYEDPRADISDFMLHPRTREIQAVASTYDRKQWQVLDTEVHSHLDRLRQVADGEIEVTSRSLDDAQWIVAFQMDAGPARYYRYETATGQATLLFTNRPSLEGLPLVPMHPVLIPSRDGLELVSYLSLPRWADPDGTGRPDSLVPLVLWVHGGPWARDEWGYHSVHQWLANRGYAVLSVNYRGSIGFGKDFTNAGNLEWGRKMHDDLIDAVNWVVEQRIADRQRIAIAGGSYGGYAALAGLTLTPEVFACGVDIVGPSNLITLLESIPPYWESMLSTLTTRVGDHRTEEGRTLLTERSPLSYVERIQKPLLIGQGANDPRVKQAESDQIVAAMQERAIPVTYILYPDEGHGFARPQNRLSFFGVMEAFLQEHLGGRYEQLGGDLQGSSMQVVAGIEGVPGLQEAVTG